MDRHEQRSEKVERCLLSEPERKTHRGAGEEGVAGWRRRPACAEDEREQDHCGRGSIREYGVPGVGACGGQCDEQACNPGGAASEADSVGEGGDEGCSEGGEGEPGVAQNGLQRPRRGSECERETRREVAGQDEERSAEEETADAAVEGLFDVTEAVPIKRRTWSDSEGRRHREGPEGEVPSARGG